MSEVDRRKKISKPRAFNEQRESMLLIKSASPADIYTWCLSLVFISILITVFLIISILT